MGAGIAQIAALGGYETLLHDPVPEALETGVERLHAALGKGAEHGRWSEEEATAAAGASVPPAASATSPNATSWSRRRRRTSS